MVFQEKTERPTNHLGAWKGENPQVQGQAAATRGGKRKQHQKIQKDSSQKKDETPDNGKSTPVQTENKGDSGVQNP